MSKYREVHDLSHHGLTLREVARRAKVKEENVKRMLRGKVPAIFTLWESLPKKQLSLNFGEGDVTS